MAKIKITFTKIRAQKQTPKPIKKKKTLNIKQIHSQKKYKSEALVRELLEKKFNDGKTVRQHKQEIIKIIGVQNYKSLAPMIQQKLKDMARGKSATKKKSTEKIKTGSLKAQTGQLIKNKFQVQNFFLKKKEHSMNGFRIRHKAFKEYIVDPIEFYKDKLHPTQQMQFANKDQMIHDVNEGASSDEEEVAMGSCLTMTELVRQFDLHRTCINFLDNNLEVIKANEPGLDNLYYQKKAWLNICNYADQKKSNPVILLFQEWIFKNKYRESIEKFNQLGARQRTRAQKELHLADYFYHLEWKELYDELKSNVDIIPITWSFPNELGYPFSLFFLGRRLLTWRGLLQQWMRNFPKESPDGLPWFYTTSGIRHGLVQNIFKDGLTKEELLELVQYKNEVRTNQQTQYALNCALNLHEIGVMDAEIESKSEKYNERKVVYNSIGDIIKTKLDPLAERKKELDSFVDVPEGDFVI